MATGTGGWETLRPRDDSLRLGDPASLPTVGGAKVRTGGAQAGYVYVDVRVKGTGHAILVLDSELGLVTQSLAPTREESWEQCQRLRARRVSETCASTESRGHILPPHGLLGPRRADDPIPRRVAGAVLRRSAGLRRRPASGRLVAFDERLADRVRELGGAAATGSPNARCRGHRVHEVLQHVLRGAGGRPDRPGRATKAGPLALEEPHVREFDFTGRPMKSTVMVEPACSGFRRRPGPAGWTQQADFASSLPPK